MNFKLNKLNTKINSKIKLNKYSVEIKKKKKKKKKKK